MYPRLVYQSWLVGFEGKSFSRRSLTLRSGVFGTYLGNVCVAHGNPTGVAMVHLVVANSRQGHRLGPKVGHGHSISPCQLLSLGPQLPPGQDRILPLAGCHCSCTQTTALNAPGDIERVDRVYPISGRRPELWERCDHVQRDVPDWDERVQLRVGSVCAGQNQPARIR